MNSIQRILLLKADHQPSRRDLTAAVALARRTGASLTFADLLADGDSISDFFRGEHRRELQRMIEPHAEAIDVSFLLLSGAPEEALAAVEGDFDLIVPAGGSDRFLTGLLRTSPIPVWVAGATMTMPRRILAAVDIDDERPVKDALNRQVLETSLALARLLDAEIEIASVWTPPGPADRLAGRLAEEEPLRRHQAAARSRVETIVEEALAGASDGVARPAIHLAGGNPVELLTEMAGARSIDLVVVGHSGRSGLPAWLRQNTAEQLIRRVGCSLVAITFATGDEAARAA